MISSARVVHVSTLCRMIERREFVEANDWLIRLWVSHAEAYDMLAFDLSIALTRVMSLDIYREILDNTQEMPDDVKAACRTLRAYCKPGITTARDRWWRRLEADLQRDVILACGTMLTGAYQKLSGRRIDEPCTEPNCPVHNGEHPAHD